MVKIKNKRGGQISSWSQSTAFREIGRAAITAFNKRRHLRKKCGAKTRGTGDPCQNIAKPNGRCHLHGGLTPKGDAWHTRQPPTGGSSKAAVRKMDRKIARAEKDAKAKRLRLRLATEAERALHDKWQKDHLPGSAARRSARRLDRRISQETRHLLTEIRERPKSPEVEELECRIAELKADRARRAALAEGFNQGVFL